MDPLFSDLVMPQIVQDMDKEAILNPWHYVQCLVDCRNFSCPRRDFSEVNPKSSRGDRKRICKPGGSGGNSSSAGQEAAFAKALSENAIEEASAAKPKVPASPVGEPVLEAEADSCQRSARPKESFLLTFHAVLDAS